VSGWILLRFSFAYSSRRLLFFIGAPIKTYRSSRVACCWWQKENVKNGRRHSNEKILLPFKGNWNFVSPFLFRWTAKGSCYYSNRVAPSPCTTNNGDVFLSSFLLFAGWVLVGIIIKAMQCTGNTSVSPFH
jgi:hypothetical protein